MSNSIVEEKEVNRPLLQRIICVCGDCLKVVPFSQERHIEEERCSCGGAFCGCPYCHEIAIKKGIWKPSEEELKGAH